MGNQLKILVFILTIGAVWLIYTNITDEKKVQSIILNHELAIGKIDRHIISSNGKSVNYGIEYSYLVDEKMIQHDYYENPFVNIPEKKPNLDIEYLVIYEKGNPKNSFILLNYPIKTNTDFEKYKELFKSKIPSDAINQN